MMPSESAFVNEKKTNKSQRDAICDFNNTCAGRKYTGSAINYCAARNYTCGAINYCAGRNYTGSAINYCAGREEHWLAWKKLAGRSGWLSLREALLAFGAVLWSQV